MDQETFDRVLAEELGKGTDRRVAEGRARSAAVRAYRKQHGEPERARPAALKPYPSSRRCGRKFVTAAPARRSTRSNKALAVTPSTS